MDEQTPVLDTANEAGKNNMRRRLGRGLNALLGGANDETAASDVPSLRLAGAEPQSDEVSLELIESNPFQPRQEFDQETINELAESILNHGVLQPLLVRPKGSRYQLIAGERRLLAAKTAGLESVPCRVKELEDKAVCEVAIVENVQRTDLSDLEKAEAFQSYLDNFGGSVKELASQLGMNRSTVSNFIRLLGLPDAVKKALKERKITGGHARALLPLDEAQQAELCKRIAKEGLSVRKTEEAVKAMQSEDEQATIPFPPAEGAAEQSGEPAAEDNKTPHVKSVEDQLRECLGMKVEIRVTDKDSGKITVHFASNDDFEKVVGALRTSADAGAHHDAA